MFQLSLYTWMFHLNVSPDCTPQCFTWPYTWMFYLAVNLNISPDFTPKCFTWMFQLTVHLSVSAECAKIRKKCCLKKVTFNLEGEDLDDKVNGCLSSTMCIDNSPFHCGQINITKNIVFTFSSISSSLAAAISGLMRDNKVTLRLLCCIKYTIITTDHFIISDPEHFKYCFLDSV